MRARDLLGNYIVDQIVSMVVAGDLDDDNVTFIVPRDQIDAATSQIRRGAERGRGGNGEKGRDPILVETDSQLSDALAFNAAQNRPHTYILLHNVLPEEANEHIKRGEWADRFIKLACDAKYALANSKMIHPFDGTTDFDGNAEMAKKFRQFAVTSLLFVRHFPDDPRMEPLKVTDFLSDVVSTWRLEFCGARERQEPSLRTLARMMSDSVEGPPPYRGVDRDGSPIDFMTKWYGAAIESGELTRAHLRQIDRKLMRAVESYCTRYGDGLQPGDYFSAGRKHADQPAIDKVS